MATYFLRSNHISRGKGSRVTRAAAYRAGVRRLAGLGGSSEAEYLALRERWAQLVNESLREAGLTARVDHRSLERQGVDREPVPNIPEKVFYAERKRGGPTAAGDEIRSRHRERVEARRSSGQERTRVVKRQKEQLRERAVRELNERDAQPKCQRRSKSGPPFSSTPK